MEKKTLQTWLFGALLLILFLAVARLFVPFFTVILWSILLYILFNPFYNALVKRLKLDTILGRIQQNLLAALFSIGTILVIIIPLVFIGIQLYRQLAALIRSAIAYLNLNPALYDREINRLSTFLTDSSSGLFTLSADQLRNQILEFLKSRVQDTVALGSQIMGSLGAFVIGLAFMSFTLYFFYMDGGYLSRILLKAVPIRKDYMAALVTKFKEITRNLFLGYILVALVQAVMSYLIFLLFRVQGALVFAIIVFFCSFIPMIGAGSVWGPIGIFRILTGDVAGGLVFLVVSGIFISTLDNLLRPLFLKDRLNLHPLIIFFAILGGLAAFGFNGLILGPMIVILFLTVLDLFLSEHGIEYDR